MHKKQFVRLIRYASVAAVLAFTLTALRPSRQVERHSIQNAPPEVQEQSESEIADAVTDTEPFTYAKSPEQIYEILYESLLNDADAGSAAAPYSSGTTVMQNEMTARIQAADSAGAESGYLPPQAAAGTDFSETNLQEAEVDEGDIVKTDGKYLYILRQDLTFAIIEAEKNGGRLLSVTKLPAGDNAWLHEMYLDGDTLWIIASESATALQSEDDVYYTDTHRQIKLFTCDVSDRSTPVLTGTVTQEGSYETSRKNGSCLYLFTSYRPDLRDTFEESVVMPRINGTEVSAGDVYLPESLNDTAYLVISSVRTDAPEEVCDSKILVSGVSNYYVSKENIYIANEQYDTGYAMTEITKFHYEDGGITGTAAGSVKGYLNDSFSMNEHDGNLRVVTTYTGDEFNAVRDFVGNLTGEFYEENWEEHNALYVLNESMQQIGAVEGLAEGETIRSARFLGDTGYFVTFRQTDPLFSVDLSDPENPVVLGELKVSGFSSYLHFYGENRLLGIGYEADEETGTVSGLKLSMFDVSDPSNVTEIHRTVLPGVTWCPAIEDYKSILADPEKNVIGFYCDNRYLVFSYDEKTGFTSELIYDFYSDLLVGQADYNTMRGLYIDGTFYLAGNTFLISFDMEKEFEKTEVLSIG